MAAKGPTALATSLAPWAKDNSAAAQINGMWKRVRIDLLRFSMPSARLAISGLTIDQVTAKTPRPMAITVSGPGCQTLFSPFTARYDENIPAISATSTGTHRLAAATLSG